MKCTNCGAVAPKGAPFFPFVSNPTDGLLIPVCWNCFNECKEQNEFIERGGADVLDDTRGK